MPHQYRCGRTTGFRLCPYGVRRLVYPELVGGERRAAVLPREACFAAPRTADPHFTKTLAFIMRVSNTLPSRRERTRRTGIMAEQNQKTPPRARRKDSARLVWDTKPRRAPNPRDIEFQTAEIVIPNPQRDAGQFALKFPTGRLTDAELDKTQMNRLIWGDNLLAMQALLAQGYEGRIRLIYLDPPFNSEEKYNFQTVLNLKGVGKFERTVSLIERLAYKDTWQGRADTYLDMLYPRLQLAKRLLAEDGSIFMHIGTEMAHYVRVALDEVFGRERFLNQITWKRTTAHSDPVRFGIISDVILYYGRSEKRVWNPQYVAYDEEYVRAHYNQVQEGTGRRFGWWDLNNPHPGGYMYELLGCPAPANGWRMPKETADRLVQEGKIGIPNTGAIPRYKRYLDEMPGVPLQDIWTDISPVNSQALEDRSFDTQKPFALLERILKSASSEGDLIADFFVGSGTSVIAAEKLNRRWIASDLGKVGIQVTRSGLVASDARPFLIENIGNYQREMIYLTGARIHEMIAIVLKLYGATPRKGTPELGTRKAPDDVVELVYVGYPDRPTTARKVEELARQAEKLDGTDYKRLVVLAWDYDYNFSTELEKRLKSSSQKVRTHIEPRTIPPEIYEYLKKAKDEEEIEPLRGKIRFHEKPYLRLAPPASARPKMAKSLSPSPSPATFCLTSL